MELVQRKPRNYHVSQDVLDEVESAILSDPRVQPAKMQTVAERAVWLAHRVLDRTVGDFPLSYISRLTAKCARQACHDYFAVLMGLNVAKCAPYFIRPSRRNVYLFDAWPDVHEAILKFVDAWSVERVFVSSRQVAQLLNSQSSSNHFIWIPEGTDPGRYRIQHYEAKSIDVLQLGRKHELYHNQILPVLEREKKTYVFEAFPGKVIFPTRDAFVDGLSKTRISICFPSNITHPARSGNIETMTARYLQSMSSKCLIVGHAPAEMIDLFGYNPVIEADMNNGGPQLLELLHNFTKYVPLIERNHAAVQNHTWRKRWDDIASVLLKPA